MRQPGALEQEVLAVLVAADAPMTPGEVQSALQADLALNTVITVLTRLQDKGAVSREGRRRTYSYLWSVDTATLAAWRVKPLLELDDEVSVLAQLIAGLAPADGRRLRALVGKNATQR